MTDELMHAAGHASVLIVEDDYLASLELEAALTEAGLNVVGVASSGDEAIALASEHRPALIIMDIQLRGTRSGIDAAIAIRELLGTRAVFATAYDDSATMAKAEPASPLGWVYKPYQTSQMIEAIERALWELGTGCCPRN